MVDLHVYKVYSERRKLNPEWQINLSAQENDVREHKAKIVMELLLEYIHEWVDITDEDEECNMEGKTLCEFSWWIQQILPDERIERRSNIKQRDLRDDIIDNILK